MGVILSVPSPKPRKSQRGSRRGWTAHNKERNDYGRRDSGRHSHSRRSKREGGYRRSSHDYHRSGLARQRSNTLQYGPALYGQTPPIYRDGAVYGLDSHQSPYSGELFRQPGYAQPGMQGTYGTEMGMGPGLNYGIWGGGVSNQGQQTEFNGNNSKNNKNMNNTPRPKTTGPGGIKPQPGNQNGGARVMSGSVRVMSSGGRDQAIPGVQRPQNVGIEDQDSGTEGRDSD
jgi:hypothetical protein